MNAPWTEKLKDWQARRPRDVMGKCFYASDLFAAEYPELRVVHGIGSSHPIEQVYPEVERDEYWRNRKLHVTIHAWCVAPDGMVVDPTGHQYKRGKVYRYPLRNGLFWIEPRQFPARCRECRKQIPLCYQGPSCCTFSVTDWAMHILDVPAPARLVAEPPMANARAA